MRTGHLLVHTAIAIVLAVAPRMAYGLQIQGFSALQHERFESGFPTAPVLNCDPQFVGDALDLSGFGWWSLRMDPSNIGVAQFAVVMISDRHFLAARHTNLESSIAAVDMAFVPNQCGSPLAPLAYEIDNVKTVMNGLMPDEPTDILVGELKPRMVMEMGMPVARYPGDDGIASYPISDMLPCDASATLLNEPVQMYGRLPRLGMGVVGAFVLIDLPSPPAPSPGINPTCGYEIVYSTTMGSDGDAHTENGDSGSPTFVIRNGQPVIVGIHSAAESRVDEEVTLDSFVGAYADQIQTLAVGASVQTEMVPVELLEFSVE